MREHLRLMRIQAVDLPTESYHQLLRGFRCRLLHASEEGTRVLEAVSQQKGILSRP